MIRSCRRNIIVAIVVVLLGTVSGAARGDVFNDIAIGLDYAGFNFLGTQNVDITGRENLLSGGVDFLTSVNFNGAVFDAGPWDLGLQGPVSFGVSTGGRVLNTLDISFQTAVGANAIATPLAYQLNVDSGNQLSTVEGTLLVDGDFSINGFGFYDLTFTYSSRQDVTSDGRFANDQTPFDSDVGPIHIRGNIFADVLALLTAPFFQATGRSSPFESFSSSAQLKEILDAAKSDILAQLATSGDVFADQTAATLRLADAADRSGAELAGITRGLGEVAGAGGIPEPAVLFLVLLGAPFVVAKRTRHRLLMH
ncbi:MAG: hypothetical protein ACYTFA_08345 [Planctomycetota bacterium]|jgi:hypothetical protein